MRINERLEDEKLFYRYFYEIENNRNVELAFECFKMFLDFPVYDMNENMFKKFIQESCFKYKTVSYHNSSHALNTLNTGVYLLKSLNRFQLSKRLQIVFLLACYLHDIDHPGSKQFKSDTLELEEHHVEVIKMQMNKYKNLFFNEKFRIYDEIVLLSDMIYSTNLIYHDEIIKEFTNKYFKEDMEPRRTPPEIGPLELKMLIKIADISASYKTFETYRLNSIILNKEILGESFCISQIDNKMEMLFLKNTALPLIEVFSRVFEGLDFMMINCKTNINKLEKIIEG